MISLYSLSTSAEAKKVLWRRGPAILLAVLLLLSLTACSKKQAPEETEVTTTVTTPVPTTTPTPTEDPQTKRWNAARTIFEDKAGDFPTDVKLNPTSCNLLDLRMADYQLRELVAQNMRADGWALLAGMNLPATDVVLDQPEVDTILASIPQYPAAVVSPVGLWFALAGLSELAEPGEAKLNFDTLLYPSVLTEGDKEDVQNALLASLKGQPGDDSYYFTLANFGLLNSDYTLDPEARDKASCVGLPVLQNNLGTIDTLKEMYGALGLTANTLDSENFKHDFNLLSAVVFEDAWFQDFDPAETKDGVFEGINGEVDVRTMFQEQEAWEYTEDGICQKIAIPLLSGGRLTIWQPFENIPVDQLLLALASDKHALNQYQEDVWVNGEDRQDIFMHRDVASSIGYLLPDIRYAWTDPELEFWEGKLGLPKFKFNKELSVYSPLSAKLDTLTLPAGDVVGTDQDGNPQISDLDVTAGDLRQLVNFKVDENIGTAELRDDLRVRHSAKARGDRFTFTVERPFVFELSYNGIPIYLGIIRDLTGLEID